MSNLDFALEPVRPVRPAAAYIGGKRILSKRLVQLIADTPHVAYAEVFVGMGGVFLRRNARPRSEVINDWSEDVSTFFRVLQHHYVAFTEMIRFQITSRANFKKLAAQDPTTLTDLQRSARFLYLQRCAFGGKVDRRGFGVSPMNSGRFDVTKLAPILENIHERLAGVVIERLPWSAFIDRYDRPGTLFYLDPPYYGSEDDYGPGMFDRDQFAMMADQLARLKGRFILSINDHPDIREIFGQFDQQPVDVRYTLGGNDKARTHGELIITGG